MKILTTVAAVLALSFAGQSFAQQANTDSDNDNKAAMTSPAEASEASEGALSSGAVVAIGAAIVIVVAVAASGGSNHHTGGTTGT